MSNIVDEPRLAEPPHQGLACSLSTSGWTAQERKGWEAWKFRFCAYGISAPNEGVRHRHTTPHVLCLLRTTELSDQSEASPSPEKTSRS